MAIRIFLRGLCALIVALATLTGRASAQDQLSFIRDAEVESIIRLYATPIFRVAGLNATDIHIYLVNDARLNAFVAGGQNLFINTGTILRSESPNQLVGIIAHETGHIAGGHLARSQEALRHATIESIIAMVAGAAAAVASKSPDAAAAAILGGQSVGERSFLQYSVGQEAAADQAGLNFLERTGQSARGLMQFFKILEGEELLSAARQDPYLRSHPFTRDRIRAVEDRVSRSKFSDTADPPLWIELHQRMKAKLAGFINPPGQTLAKYKAEDPSIAARYARTVALYRIPDLKRALPAIDALIQERPDDPYFRELKGQMLFENGRIKEAVPEYEKAVELKPDSALLRVGLAQAQIETNDPALNLKALAHLNEAVRFEDQNGDAWRFMATAQGKAGQFGMAALALAEEGLVNGNKKQARQQATRALQILPPSAGTARLRAQDIQHEADRPDKN